MHANSQWANKLKTIQTAVTFGSLSIFLGLVLFFAGDPASAQEKNLEAAKIAPTQSIEQGDNWDGVYVPVNASFCRDKSSLVLEVEVCNYSAGSHPYELYLRPLTLSSFLEDETSAQPLSHPVTVMVPAQSCQMVPIRLSRPAALDTGDQVIYYDVVLTNLDTSVSVSMRTSVDVHGTICSADPATFLSVLAPGQPLRVPFVLSNTSKESLHFEYMIEARPTDLDPAPSWKSKRIGTAD